MIFTSCIPALDVLTIQLDSLSKPNRPHNSCEGRNPFHSPFRNQFLRRQELHPLPSAINSSVDQNLLLIKSQVSISVRTTFTNTNHQPVVVILSKNKFLLLGVSPIKIGVGLFVAIPRRNSKKKSCGCGISTAIPNAK